MYEIIENVYVRKIEMRNKTYLASLKNAFLLS